MNATPWILATLLLGQTPPNLDFARGNLDHWQGQGFAYLAPNPQHAVPIPAGAWSADAISPTRKGMIRTIFTVPQGANRLYFQAYAQTAPNLVPDVRLEVVLTDENQTFLPRFVKSAGSWVKAPRLLSPWVGQPRHYYWDIAGYQGKRLQIVLIDDDDRPGHFVFAGGFQLNATTPFRSDDFTALMLRLQAEHQLAPMARYDGKRFTAISNAGQDFTTQRIKNCEIFHDHFLNHFRSKGFPVHAPAQRLMMAVFDSRQGVEAYFKSPIPAGVTGLYDIPSNRLVLFNYEENNPPPKSQGPISRLNPNNPTQKRQLHEFNDEVNLSTTMHECAHQISFNCGLLNRNADRPLWLAEGLATYCETTEQGDWTALGSPNTLRIRTLLKSQGKWIPLDALVGSDRWLQSQQVLLGYAQSWALFHMLMTQQPRQFRKYLETIYHRPTPDHRMTDFAEAFGSPRTFERQYHHYLQSMMQNHPPARTR